MKNAKYAAAVVAVAITLAGCASGGNTDAAPAAAPTAAPSPTATTAQVVDPLDRLPTEPFGLDPQAMVAYAPNYGITIDLPETQSDAEAIEALRTFLQLKWVENERSPLFTRGTEVNEGSIKDSRHFGSSEILEPLLEMGQKAQDHTAALEADENAEPDEDLWFPLYFGRVATKADGKSTDDEIAKNWPDVSEDDVAGSVYIDGEEKAVPSMKGSKVELLPRVTNIYNDPEAPGDILIAGSVEYDIPLVDGRIAEFSIPCSVQLTFENGKWAVGKYMNDGTNASPVTAKG